MQLVFDEPIDSCVLIENERAVDDATFITPLPSHKQKKFKVQDNREKNVTIRFIDSKDNISSIRMHYPFDKEFPRAITNNSSTKSESIVHRKKRNFILLSQIVHKT